MSALLLTPFLALAQTPKVDIEENSTWLPHRNCWCVSSEKLAKAVFNTQNLKLRLNYAQEEAADREEVMLGNFQLQLKTTKDWCDQQLLTVRDSCSSQMQNVVEQTNTLVNDITDSYGNRLKEVTGLTVPPKTKWYASPIFWGIAGTLVGGVTMYSLAYAIHN